LNAAIRAKLLRKLGAGKKRIGSRDDVRNPKKIKFYEKIKININVFLILILVKIWTYYRGFKRAFNR
jgi:hypothetical protein